MISDNPKKKKTNFSRFNKLTQSKTKEQLEYDKQKVIEISDSIKESYEKLSSLIRLGVNAGRINNNSLDELLESFDDAALKKLLKN